MILKDISGIDFELDGACCDIVYGVRFDINGAGEINTYTRCGIWYLKAKGGKFRITIPNDTVFSAVNIRAKGTQLHSCGFCALNTDLRMSDSLCFYDGIDSRSLYAELGEGRMEIRVNGFTSSSFNCGRGEMSIDFCSSRKDCYVKTVRGTGSILIDGEKLPRSYVSDVRNGAEIYIKCGLGTVNALFSG